MFERFTDAARWVMLLAQEEARRLNHDYLGTEHLLLGLIREGEGVAARALDCMGISLDKARTEVEELSGRGRQDPPGNLPSLPGPRTYSTWPLRRRPGSRTTAPEPDTSCLDSSGRGGPRQGKFWRDWARIPPGSAARSSG